MAWTAPRTWVAGETVTAAVMNTHVRDNLKAIGDAWTSYTPVLGGAGWAIGNGTRTGAYIAAGKLVAFRFSITFGSTSTYGGAASPTVSLPVTPAGDWDFFPVQAIDASGSAVYPVFARYVSGALSFHRYDNAFLSATVPFPWATSDVLRGGGVYQAA